MQSDPVDNYVILVPLDGPIELDQRAQRNVLEPGQFGILSTGHPYEVRCEGLQKYSEFLIRIPGPLLRQHVPECIAVVPFPSVAGVRLASSRVT
ncbi:MAG: hypothetical protein ABW110_21420 [Steroidobacteraceae bacterium]